MRGGLNLETRLEQLARGGSVPVVAVLPARNPNAFGSQNSFSTPAGKPVQEFLDHLERNDKHQIYKWREGVLLVNYPFWFTESNSAIPYSLLSRVHPGKMGQAPLRDWIALMSKISDDQANWFAATYQYSGDMKQLRPMLLLIDQYPHIMETTGSNVDGEKLTHLWAASSPPRSEIGIRRTEIACEIRMDDPAVLHGSTLFLHLEWRDDAAAKWVTINKLPLPTYTESYRERCPQRHRF